MRLGTQIFLSGLGTALLCTILGSWLLGQQAARSAEALLDGQLRVGGQALRQQWQVRREQRYAIFESVAKQTFFRAYLSVGDRAQMGYFAELTKQKGADVIAIVDRQGEILASLGPGAALLVSSVLRADWPRHGGWLTLPAGTAGTSGGALLEVQRIPVGDPEPVGFLIAAHIVEESSLRRAADPLGIVAGVALDDQLVSTLPRSEPLAAAALRSVRSPELQRLRARYRIDVTDLGPAKLLVAVPLTAVRAFAADLLRQIALVLVLLLVATLLVSLVTLNSITRPLRRLSQAAERLGLGDLQSSRALSEPMIERGDEIGVLSRTVDTAAKRIADVLGVGQELAENLSAAISDLEQSAAAVQGGADRQEEQIRAVGAALGPIRSKLDTALSELSQQTNTALFLSLSLSSFEHATSGGANMVLIMDGSSAGGMRADPKAAAVVIRRQFADLRQGLHRIRDIQVDSQLRSTQVSAAAAEIGHISKQHAIQARSLQESAERLRQDAKRLSDLLSRLRVVSSEQAPAAGSAADAAATTSPL
jgi:methyl-accepting chemotaxis protein